MYETDITCEYCGRVFPKESEGVGTLCDGCYIDRYCFTCAWCEEYGDVADQHRYVAVFDEDAAGVPLAGFYRVTDLPYYTQGVIGKGWLQRSSVQWWGHLPPDLEEPDGYPCGHFCADCQREMLEDIAVRQGISHDIA